MFIAGNYVQIQKTLLAGDNLASVHNVNGLFENIRYHNAFNGDTKVPIYSQSTSMGSGHLGMINRQAEFFDMTDSDYQNAWTYLQTMNQLHMPLVGVKFS